MSDTAPNAPVQPEPARPARQAQAPAQPQAPEGGYVLVGYPDDRLVLSDGTVVDPRHPVALSDAQVGEAAALGVQLVHKEN